MTKGGRMAASKEYSLICDLLFKTLTFERLSVGCNDIDTIFELSSLFQDSFLNMLH